MKFKYVMEHFVQKLNYLLNKRPRSNNFATSHTVFCVNYFTIDLLF